MGRRPVSKEKFKDMMYVTGNLSHGMQRTDNHVEQKLENFMNRKKRINSINLLNKKNLHCNNNFRTVEKSDNYFKKG